MRNVHQMSVMAAQLATAAYAGGGVPSPERFITERAFFVGM
ncbi:MAG TPA: hypothetical protein VJ761_06560 [Ktedonobacteraceae bacterium]|nr:hypothetical protein [Ktedonobacteraceae bacterium]